MNMNKDIEKAIETYNILTEKANNKLFSIYKTKFKKEKSNE